MATVARWRAPFGPPAGFPDWPGLYPPCLGFASFPARSPSSNSQRVGGNIRYTGGVYVAIQRRRPSFTCDAQHLAEKLQLIIRKRAEIQGIQDLLLHRPTIRARQLDLVGIYPARRCPRSITKAEGHDLRAAGLNPGPWLERVPPTTARLVYGLPEWHA